MARTFPGDFADRAYERFCAKRDREAQISKRGGRANGHPLKSKTKVQDNDNINNDNSLNNDQGINNFEAGSNINATMTIGST